MNQKGLLRMTKKIHRKIHQKTKRIPQKILQKIRKILLMIRRRLLRLRHVSQHFPVCYMQFIAFFSLFAFLLCILFASSTSAATTTT